MAWVEAKQPLEPRLPGTLGQRSASAEAGYPKQVPASRTVREAIRQRAWQMAARWDRCRPLSQGQIEAGARSLLDELGLPEEYLGWTMVMLGSAFWQPQVAAVPVHRRLLLLPHCFRDVEKCQGHYTDQELLCQDCGACQLCFFRAEAKRLGYQVLIAEGTPIVVDMILHGRVDAILGVACLNSLERALEKILQVGIPCMAVPLWESRCRASQTDEDWVLEMLRTPYLEISIHTETYLHLLRATTELFQPARLSRFLPGFSADGAAGPLREIPSDAALRMPSHPSGTAASDDGTPVWETTQRLAWDFLLRGGKHLRPFLTLAAYDAMTDAQATRPNGKQVMEKWPDAVWQLALAIEIFHKASLVHDDIEDDDPYRYGQPALHRQYGVPMALNVGDFLIGWGYRLAAEATRELAPEAAAEILAHLAQAHVRLSEGQGGELAWRQTNRKELSPLEVLKIYALKTAPAFEAALYIGLRLAGPVDSLQQTLARYSRQLGVAFQIQNDLADWKKDHSNKRALGTDVLGARPTILWALARQSLPADDLRRLDQLLADAALLASKPLPSTPPSETVSSGAGSEVADSAPGRMPHGELNTRPAKTPLPAALGSRPEELPEAPNSRPAQTPPQTSSQPNSPPQQPDALLAEVRLLYEKADAFAQAEALVQKHLQRAHQLADQISPPALNRLLHYVADMVLNRS